MKVLLDENLPHLLRSNLGDHEVYTARYKGWAGLKNGELLTAAVIQAALGSATPGTVQRVT